MADLPQELFEAAEMDGANHFRQMLMVVLPLSAPILGVVAIMHAVSQWNDFVLPLIIIRDEARLPVMVQLLRMSGRIHQALGPAHGRIFSRIVPRHRPFHQLDASLHQGSH